MPTRPATADWALEETDNPLYAQDRGFYEVVKWMRDGMKVDRVLYAVSSLGRAQEIFAGAIKHRPRIRLTGSKGRNQSH